MKKRILMLLLIVLLTGCTTKSEVKVGYDGNVNEKVTVLTNTVAFKNDRYSIKQMIESVLSNYSKAKLLKGKKKVELFLQMIIKIFVLTFKILVLINMYINI